MTGHLDNSNLRLLALVATMTMAMAGCGSMDYRPQEGGIAAQSPSLEQARAEVKHTLTGAKFFINSSSGDGGDNEIADVKFIGSAIVFIGKKKPASVLISNSTPWMRLNTNAPWCELFFKDKDQYFSYLSSPISNEASYLMGIGVSVSNECDTQLVDALAALKQATKQAKEQQDRDFEQIATNYRAASPKPGPTEEIHRIEVQGNGAIKDKDFYGAADIYTQGAVAAPWWPPFHYNLALVLGDLQDYGGAAAEMQRYLELVPDASNARAAQDKIYEWQREVPDGTAGNQN